MKAQPHHDSAAFLEVVRVRAQAYSGHFEAGWYVRRICRCHYHQLVSVRFETRVRAEHCRDVLDDDYRRREERQARLRHHYGDRDDHLAPPDGEPS